MVYNLLDNACKYAQEGGLIDIRTGRAGDKIRVSIANSGKDISPEQLPYIFDRFYKVDQSRGVDANSAGLGLYLVKQILNMHGEEITAASENGVTTFAFTLAAADTPLAAKYTVVEE